MIVINIGNHTMRVSEHDAADIVRQIKMQQGNLLEELKWKFESSGRVATVKHYRLATGKGLKEAIDFCRDNIPGWDN